MLQEKSRALGEVVACRSRGRGLRRRAPASRTPRSLQGKGWALAHHGRKKLMSFGDTQGSSPHRSGARYLYVGSGNQSWVQPLPLERGRLWKRVGKLLLGNARAGR